MKVKDYFVPKDFVEAMGRGIPGFNNLEKAQRTRVAFYLWMEGTNRRQHRTKDGMSISYLDLEESFRRGGFKALNDTLQIFDVIANWSKVEKLTRSYKLTEHVQKVRDEYMAKVDDKLLTSLLTLDSKEMHTLPKAIASLDLDDVAAIAWKDAKPLNMIRVDVDKMREVLRYMENMLIRKRGKSSEAQVGNITYQIGILKRLIILSNNDVIFTRRAGNITR